MSARSVSVLLASRATLWVRCLGSLYGILEQSMGARNRVGIGLSYRPARLHRLAEFIPWNRFLGSKIVYKNGLATYAGGVDSAESIPGLLKSLKNIVSVLYSLSK
jgi:hypothetical protein